MRQPQCRKLLSQPHLYQKSMAMAPRRTIFDSLHRCLCPKFHSSLTARTHGPVTVFNRFSSLSAAKNLSAPSESVSKAVPEDEISNSYSHPPIRKIPKSPDTKRVVRERFHGGSTISYRSPHSDYSGISKVIDLASRNAYPGVFYAAEEIVRLEGYVPDTKLYTVLIEACGNFPGCLLQPLAFRLFNEMKDRGLELNSTIYHSLLRLLATSPDYLMRAQVLDEMKRGWYDLSDDGWEDVIAGYILDGHLEMALEIIESRRQGGQVLHRNTYNDIIQGLCNAGEVDEALRLLRGLETEITWVTPPALAYTILVAATDQLHLEGTLFCWRKIIDRDMFNPDDGLCLSTLNVAARYGQPLLASDVFRVLGNRGFRFEEHHYAALLESYVVADDLMAAFSVLSLMRRSGVSPAEYTARPITTRLLEESSIKDALDILKKMKKIGKDVDVTAINALIAAHATRKDINAAFEIYKEMPEFDLRPQTITFNILLRLAADLAKKQFAMDLVSEMKEMGIKPDVETYEHLFDVSLAQVNYEDAFMYLEEMKAISRRPKPRMYKRLAIKCYKQGDNNRYQIAMGELVNMGVDVRGFLREIKMLGRA